jgi:hypothetical protein
LESNPARSEAVATDVPSAARADAIATSGARKNRARRMPGRVMKAVRIAPTWLILC